MNNVFADTSYWIALINPRDDLYGRLHSFRDASPELRIVTTQWVLIELLNYFAERGNRLRESASTLVESLSESTDVVVVPHTGEAFLEAFQVYASRPDKSWSMTDCASFLIMQRYGIDSALTYDHHFEQAGFKALLR